MFLLAVCVAVLAPVAYGTSIPCFAGENVPGCIDRSVRPLWTAPNLCRNSSPAWELTFEDDFQGSSLNLNYWNIADNRTHVPRELQMYLKEDVSVEGGNLVLRTRFNPTYWGSKLYNWTSGWVDTKFKVAQRFGRFEVRARLPNPDSIRIWPAHWLMPNVTVCWPVGGEIDIMESWGGSDNNTAQGTLHFGEQCQTDMRAGPNGWYPDTPHHVRPINYSEAYHVFAVEWDTNCVKWFVDGHQFWQRWRDDQPAPHGAMIPQLPMYVILNTAMAWYGAPFDYAPLMPVYHYIDYVRIYREKQ